MEENRNEAESNLPAIYWRILMHLQVCHRKSRFAFVLTSFFNHSFSVSSPHRLSHHSIVQMAELQTHIKPFAINSIILISSVPKTFTDSIFVYVSFSEFHWKKTAHKKIGWNSMQFEHFFEFCMWFLFVAEIGNSLCAEELFPRYVLIRFTNVGFG